MKKDRTALINGAQRAAERMNLTANVRIRKSAKMSLVVQRRGEILDVFISDLLEDAPENVVEDLVLTTMYRMAGTDRCYSEETVDFLCSGLLCKRFSLLVRKVAFTSSPEGKYKDLRDSYERLQKTGLIEPVPELMMVWTNPDLQATCGVSNSLRMIWVSGRLDDPAVPNECLDAVVYTLLTDISRAAFTENEAERYRRLEEAEHRFPKYHALMEEADSYIRGNGNANGMDGSK